MPRAPPCRVLRIVEMSEASAATLEHRASSWLPVCFRRAWIQTVAEPLSYGLVTRQYLEAQNNKLVLWLKCEITCGLGGKQHGKIHSYWAYYFWNWEFCISVTKKCKRDARDIYCAIVWELMSFNPFIYFRTFWAKCFVHWGRLLVHREVVWKSQ